MRKESSKELCQQVCLLFNQVVSYNMKQFQRKCCWKSVTAYLTKMWKVTQSHLKACHGISHENVEKSRNLT